jgi:predicted RNA binding protein YcfA (HicA-like mRNA interferase family)
MAKLPVVSGKKLLKTLLKAGFLVSRQTGSHAQLYHPDNPERLVTIPVHDKDLPKGTLKNILRQAKLTVEELLRLL